MSYSERILLNNIRENVEELLENYLFEPVDDTQRMLENHLQNFVDNNYLSAFEVVDVRHKGNYTFDVYLQPRQSAEYITMNCIISTDNSSSKHKRVQIELDENLFKM